MPRPLPPGQVGFKQFPTPGTERLDLSPGLPGEGMVTGKIEPCIRVLSAFYLFIVVTILAIYLFLAISLAFLPQYSLMFLSTSINVLFTHDPTSYVAFYPIVSK